MIATTVAVLAARLAAGTLLAAGIVHWVHPVPAGYLRLVLRGVVLAMALGLLAGRNRPEAPGWALFLVAAIALTLLARRLADRPPLLAALMCGVGAGSALLPSWLAVPGFLTLNVAANLSGAALLGGAAATMLLGHWYLVDTSLSIRPLGAGSSLFSAAVGARVATVGLALLTGGAAELRLLEPSDLIYSTSALFFAFRVIAGLLGPLFLAVMISRTVRIRSTQSATGLLYVALILVLFGEITAAFLEIVTGGRLV